MSAISTKPLSDQDQQQIIQGAYNSNEKTLSVDGFVNSKVGHKVTRTIVQASPAIDDYRFLDVVRTDTMTTTNLSPTLTNLTDAKAKYVIGQYLFGTGIQANTTILAIPDEVSLTMSLNATANGSVPVKVANLLVRLRIQYDDASRSNVDDVERLD